jgi:hypothetical protein
MKAWPPTAERLRRGASSKSRYFLWYHEWNKHGKDFAQNYLSLSQTSSAVNSYSYQTYKNNYLQKAFFSDVLNLYQTINTRLSSNPTTKQQLATLLGVQENALYTRCNRSGNIQEIRICTRMGHQGSKVTYSIVKCRRGRSNCRGSAVKLQGFK